MFLHVSLLLAICCALNLFFYLCLTRIQIAFSGKVDGSTRWRRLHGPLADQITQLSEQQTKHMPVRLIKHSGLPIKARFHEAISVLGSFVLQRKIHR